MFCVKCGTAIPDEAKFCSACGVETEVAGNTEAEALVHQKGVHCPTFPEDLSIGRRLLSKAGAMAKFYEEYNPGWKRMNQGVVFILHKNGIRVCFPDGQKDIRVHYSQVIDVVRYEDRGSLIKYRQQRVGVAGGAIAGGLLLGPLGAIVGAIAGTGNQEIKENDFLVLHFWDVETRHPRTLLLCDRFGKGKFKTMAERANEQIMRYREILKGG